MHHKTDIKPVIENCTTSFYREMKESISEHYFHILWYIFDSNFNIHKQHYSNDISSDVYSKEKGIPALSRLTKQSTCQEYVLYQVWSLQFTNWQEWGVFKKCNKKTKTKGSRALIYNLRWNLLPFTSLHVKSRLLFRQVMWFTKLFMVQI